MSEININGRHTDARIFTDEVDETCIEQVQELVNHEAFQNPVRIMPDAHAGAGAVIGFTMELGERICPNTVGVDIGCGMTALRLGRPDELEIRLGDDGLMRDLDESIRAHVPMGRNTFADTHIEQQYHIVNDFPWEACEQKLQSLNDNWNGEPIESPDYGKEYFLDLCERVGYDVNRAINSIGTLGGGNHFVEISRSDETGDYWVVVHSGSRGIGLSVAEYWQEQAHQAQDDRADTVRDMLSGLPDGAYKFDVQDVSDRELLNWVQGGMGEDWKDTSWVRLNYEGEEIGRLINEMKDVSSYLRENAGGDDLDFLEGEDRHGYLRDMIFAQTYAAESRLQMVDSVAHVLGVRQWDPEDLIVSTHNYIDFDDLTIRKGATRVHQGERGVIPFNMRDGAIIVRGEGNDEWNRSAPHGAGRRGSRRWAFRQFDLAEFSQEMDGIFSTSVTGDTIDEAPMAYKSRDVILERIEETASVEETLTPVHNLKAEE
ncbi:RtcB [Halovirus HCTV-5]|uniref:tRNA splicing ligase n=1 Tax=Halovirus HCTV-5 TaxID=1273748 RepID=UPI0003348A6C|nr:tRNA splicing ligase [Halovirus HCTV-5]AGM11655.1 RtcB [Halovirus HCTV-5]